jgi:hypothetical protein
MPPERDRRELMVAILAGLSPDLAPSPGVLAVSPDRTFEVLLVVFIIAVAAFGAFVALKQ